MTIRVNPQKRRGAGHGISVAARSTRGPAALATRSEEGARVTRKQLVVVLIALVVGVIVGGGAVASQSSISVEGAVGATEQESDEGYFAVGSDTMLVAKPRSALHQWLRSHNGQQVRVTIELNQPTQ